MVIKGIAIVSLIYIILMSYQYYEVEGRISRRASGYEKTIYIQQSLINTQQSLIKTQERVLKRYDLILSGYDMNLKQCLIMKLLPLVNKELPRKTDYGCYNCGPRLIFSGWGK